MRVVRKMKVVLSPVLLLVTSFFYSQQIHAVDIFSVAVVGGGVAYLLSQEERSHSHVSHWKMDRVERAGPVPAPTGPNVSSRSMDVPVNRLAVKAYSTHRGLVLCGADGICLK